jgi:hypothetical protein
MAPVTRQRSRNKLTPSVTSETPTSITVSPLFSNPTSVRSETPITSDNNTRKNGTVIKPTGITTRSKFSRKRAAESGVSDQEVSTRLPSKRRAVTQNTYVEIPSIRASKVIILLRFTLLLDSARVFVRGPKTKAKERPSPKPHLTPMKTVATTKNRQDLMTTRQLSSQRTVDRNSKLLRKRNLVAKTVMTTSSCWMLPSACHCNLLA